MRKPDMRLPNALLLPAAFFVIASSFLFAAKPAATREWVSTGADGRLVYRTDTQGNQIPDFSAVGYHGGAALPEMAVKTTLEPATGDSTTRIQTAIDELAKMPADAKGQRGAILLKKGRYHISGSLHISTGGIVLRGEGDSSVGTVLIATGAKQRSLIIIGGKANKPVKVDEDSADDSPVLKGIKRAITNDYVPVGATTFQIDNVSGLKVGDEIIVHRPSTAEWIHELGMDRIPPATHAVVQWKAGSKDLFFNRIITNISDRQITINAPIVNAIEKKYGGGTVSLTGNADVIREAGIENLYGDSEYVDAIDEKHGWTFIEFAAARDSFAKKVTSIHFGYSCVNILRASSHITVDHCACLDPISQITGGRRYSFEIGGQLCLVQHCNTRNGRHDFVMNSVAAGPNVFYDCVAEESHADSGPHHRWSVGVLYDNVTVKPSKKGTQISGGEINIRNRGNSGTGHGWAGANQVLWNCKAAEIKVENPPTAQNWAIGCIAEKHSGDGYFETFGTKAVIKSLYEAQVKDKLDKQK